MLRELTLEPCKCFKLLKIEFDNFKSFHQVSFQPSDYNVLIGANASGKTNFLQLFKFLTDIKKEGLENAKQLQGGYEYLKNLYGDKNEIKINFSFNTCNIFEPLELMYFMEVPSELENKYNFIYVDFKKLDYKLTLFSNENAISEKMQIFSEIVGVNERQENSITDLLGKFYLKIEFNANDKKPVITFDWIEKNIYINLTNEHFVKYFNLNNFKSDNLLSDGRFFFNVDCWDFPIYNFDPNILKKAVDSKGKIKLQENGENINIVLKRILEDDKNKRIFLNLVSYILPFLKDFKIIESNQNIIKYGIVEKYKNDVIIPSEFLSEGTIYIIALIIVLFFENKKVILIEEPEKYIHPALISSLMTLIKDASKFKQIFITTHSPEIVRHSDVENIFLVSRDDKGFSNITKPIDREDVKVFLQNELGLADLFVDNVL